MMRSGKRRVRVHRASYEEENGAIPDDVCVLHRCDTPSCINPYHLFLGSREDNNKDKTAKGRQAKGRGHGLRGEHHPLAKLSAEDVAQIREASKQERVTQRALAAAFGISQSQVNNIINNHRWS
ncbi:HNH endonuclease [Ralstonia phage GP4]|uniref:HNH endonuclease n=1 Tax=Ralstonia phage GP4 TaxID=2282904 RepID=A0A345GTX7_9CAUD|nr:endonuclease [Ralstonia phage GP4]AXG67741.1 HNH endonuclease [Ralstonia phage GP4]